MKSKENLFSLLKIKLIRRKACESHPNPSDADINDIIELFDNSGANDFELQSLYQKV